MTSRLPRLGDLERRTAHESVTEALREAVLGGILPAGTRLVQAELAAQFGVSNTPVREAMRQLSVEGLIQFDSYRGATVRAPTLDEVREVYELRLLLEPVAMRKAVQLITVETLTQARDLQQEMARTTDVGPWVLLNRRFHGTLIAAARSPRLASIIAGLEDVATAQVALSIKADFRRLTDGNTEHQQILQAVENRDADQVVDLVSRHLRSTVQAVESLAQSADDTAASG
jgi:DNA-binding GntR family transcriptional regulator